MNTPFLKRLLDDAAQPFRTGGHFAYHYARGKLSSDCIFRELLRQYPKHERVPDATYFLGETFAAESPDSAAAYYQKVVADFPQSPRAASSLYKLGLLAERKKDLEAARGFFTRVVRDYPRSDEAALARDRLKTPAR